MSKLTDKIEALTDRTYFRSHEAREGFQRIIDTILADVRELETRNACLEVCDCDDCDDKVRQAKREAYEHAQHLVQYKDSSPWQAIQNAIDALNTEGDDDTENCDKCAKARKTAGGQWHCVEHGENDNE